MITAAFFVAFWLACSTLAVTRHPIFGLYLYFAATYVHPPSRWWGELLPDLRWSLLAAAVTAAAILIYKDSPPERPPWIANVPAAIFTSYTAWMWIQSLWALDRETHLQGCVQFVKYLLAFWMIYRVVDSKDRVRTLLFLHAAGCGLLGVYARYTERVGGRLDGVGGPGIDDANTLGMYLATGVIACAGLILTQTGWRRYVVFGLLAFTVNGFVLANSRGSLLGLAAGGVVFVLLKAREHGRLFWLLAFLALPAAAVVVDQVFIDRMFSIRSAVEQGEDMDDSARSRLELKKAQVQMFLDHPMGAGFRGTETLSPRYLDRRWLSSDESGNRDDNSARSSHNTFLTTLVEQGLLGALMFCALLGWLVVTCVRIRSWSKSKVDSALTTFAAALCGGLTIVYVAGLATDYLLAEVQFWFFAGLVVVIRLAGSQVKALGPGPAPLGFVR